jgi:hypothetical protein
MSLSPLPAAGAVGGAGAPTASPAPPSPASAAAPAAPAPAQGGALATAVQAAAGAQDTAAPLLAELAAAQQRPDLPPEVRVAALKTLAAALPVDPPPDASALSDAVARSGLFLEADLAQGAPDPGDLKAALLTLSASLAASGASGRTGAAGAAPPPYPGGPLQAQPADGASLPPDAALAQVLDQLARRTSAAVSRLVLLQAGSTRTGGAAAKGGAAHWLFELPLATPEGAAIAPFQVDRDTARREAQDEAPVWRARFSLDVGAAGPVHARLSLQGDRVRVALWAEDAATVQDLEGRREELAEALRAQGFDPRLRVQPGAPDAAAAPTGGLVDRAV